MEVPTQTPRATITQMPQPKREDAPQLKDLFNNVLLDEDKQMSKQIDDFLSLYSRESREIALSLRALILDVFPQAVEQIDPKSGIIAYGFDRTYKGLVCAIAPHAKHVNLMFSKGKQLPDPNKILAGTGKSARHIKIRSEEETLNPSLRIILEAAVRLDSKQ